jgi:hypothetical protein
MKNRDLGTLVCSKCGIEAKRTGYVQKYCRACSEIRSTERRKLWARVNPPKPEVIRKTKSRKIISQKYNGIQNANKPRSIIVEKHLLDFNHCVVVTLPFSYSLSKNAIYSLSAKGGHLFLREQAKTRRLEIVLAIHNAMQDNPPFYQAKVYLDIFVEKPDHKGDAINVIDLVCDAVKYGIGVDDRWFCIRSLDWQIVKQNGRLIIGIYQAATEDHLVCHRCGRYFPLSMMNNRVCKECSTFNLSAF